MTLAAGQVPDSDAAPLTDIRHRAASAHLDMIRGAAAIAVLAYHVRYRFFLDYSDLDAPGALDRAFYGLTSFGHDAVMVFFVLSGFFISSSVIGECERKQWSWRKYGISRCTRLYVVLIPGLLLTLFWDRMGLDLYGSNPIYTGAAQAWKHDFFPVESRLGAVTVLGNLGFLQTIRVPPLGSNDPLWSLAYEFWYYLAFPCFFLGIVGPIRRWRRSFQISIGIAILWAVGKGIALYFPIWLLGTLICYLPRVGGLEHDRWLRAATWLSAGLFATMMAAGHVASVKLTLGDSTIIMDYLTGIGFALFLYVLLHHRRALRQGFYSTVARTMAGFSFTLYVVHMPLLVFLRAMLVQDQPWSPTSGTLAAAMLLTGSGVAYAAVVARITESHTESVRRFLMARTARPAAAR